MKKLSFLSLSVLVILGISVLSFTFISLWTPDQVIEPADLAKKLNSSGQKPLVVNVGPMQSIKSAQSAGIGNSTAGMNKFIQIVDKADREQMVVIYCGCCSMENCPNIKGPFDYLINAGFQNPKVLHITTDLNTDWVSKGYPMN